MIPKMNDCRITERELALIFDVSEETVVKFVITKQLPCLQINNKMYFEFFDILRYFVQLERGVSC